MIIDLPSYVHLDFTNVSGENGQPELLIYNPLSEEEIKKEVRKEVRLKVIKNSIVWICIGAGTIAGVGAVAGAGSALLATAIIISAIVGYAISAFVRGVAALLDVRSKGFSIREALYSDIEIFSILPEYKETIKKAMTLFINQSIKLHKKADEIRLFCPISHDFMLYPAGVCKESPLHVYDMVSILKWIETKKAAEEEPTCPECKSNIHIHDFSIDQETKKEIVEIVNKLFLSMEVILRKMTSNAFSTTLNFVDQETLDKINDMANRKVEILTSPDDLLNKLINPDQLTEEEAYAVAYNLALIFKPTLAATRKIRSSILRGLNTLLLNNIISDETFITKQDEVWKWPDEFLDSLIPEECSIIINYFIAR